MSDAIAKSRLHRVWEWIGLGMFLLVLYVLSSGPVLAGAFWLREATGRNEFYSVGFFYYPLFKISNPDNVLMLYIGWWVELFGTVGPG